VDGGTPARISTAFEIMLQAPLGGAAFNNEFGRPCITGYFRTLLLPSPANPDPNRWVLASGPGGGAGGT